MEMGCGHTRAWFHRHLEEIQAALAAFLALQEPQLQAADAYHLDRHGFLLIERAALGSTRPRQHLVDFVEKLASPVGLGNEADIVWNFRLARPLSPRGHQFLVIDDEDRGFGTGVRG
jgi:hypothetical protein